MASTFDSTVSSLENSQASSLESIARYCQIVASNAKAASRILNQLPTMVKNRWLIESANQLVAGLAEIEKANRADLSKASEYGLTLAEIDRLTLTPTRIQEIAQGLRDVAALPDPVGEIVEGGTRPNGLELRKIRVPLGVLFFIYESRPNVTADAAAIAVKSGNAIILRGGKEAIHSSNAIVKILQQSAIQVGIPENAVQLVNTVDRQAVGEFLKLDRFIDLAIPRGGEGLIRRVVSEATMPVLKHYDGNCHVYVDRDADFEQALAIIENAKCQRMGVCNAMESLLVHSQIASDFLPRLFERLQGYRIEYRGDARTCSILPESLKAEEEDWSKEFLGPIMSVAIVDSVDDAIEHINRYGSKHTDGIVTRSIATANRFVREVDSAAVMVNASTRFNDGSQLGMGAEIGISTDKFHARGPCGLKELTTYKYVVYGDGHIRV